MELREENAKLRQIIDGLTHRVAAQSELLTRKAERKEAPCTTTTPTIGESMP